MLSDKEFAQRGSVRGDLCSVVVLEQRRSEKQILSSLVLLHVGFATGTRRSVRTKYFPVPKQGVIGIKWNECDMGFGIVDLSLMLGLCR